MQIKLPLKFPNLFLVKGLNIIIFALSALAFAALLIYHYQTTYTLNNKLLGLTEKEAKLNKQIAQVSREVTDLKNRDEVKINKTNTDEIKNIQKTYNQSVLTYEKLLDFSGDAKKKTELQNSFAKSIKLLSDKNYASASAILVSIEKQIEESKVKVSKEFKIPESIKESSVPPSSGYSRQKVSTDIGDFLVDIISADLNSTRVIVDTASESDCRDNCPVLPLSDYASRNGAFAGVNGSYFCPAAYPTCAGKANSFDTLLMNKNKRYFNSDNNVYSSVPAVIFLGSSARFVGASQEWGRDTGVDAVIANHPLMVFNNNVAFGGNSDPKQGSKGSRSFVGATGSTAYIGVVHNATVAESARVLHKMGIQNALNLDSGGSTALWSGGYKVGPGRNIPNALLFIRK